MQASLLLQPFSDFVWVAILVTGCFFALVLLGATRPDKEDPDAAVSWLCRVPAVSVRSIRSHLSAVLPDFGLAFFFSKDRTPCAGLNGRVPKALLLHSLASLPF